LFSLYSSPKSMPVSDVKSVKKFAPSLSAAGAAHGKSVNETRNPEERTARRLSLPGPQAELDRFAK
jgi:hypothetical protein